MLFGEVKLKRVNFTSAQVGFLKVIKPY